MIRVPVVVVVVVADDRQKTRAADGTTLLFGLSPLSDMMLAAIGMIAIGLRELLAKAKAEPRVGRVARISAPRSPGRPRTKMVAGAKAVGKVMAPTTTATMQHFMLRSIDQILRTTTVMRQMDAQYFSPGLHSTQPLGTCGNSSRRPAESHSF